MNDRLVINTGPLILLAKLGALDVAAQLPITYIAPPAVREELDAGAALGYVEVRPSWLDIRELHSPILPLSGIFLGRGEAEVIQLALDLGVRVVCIDDLRGRKAAKASGLDVTGLLGLLGRTKLLGIVPRVKPFADELLRTGGRYSAKVIGEFLLEFGE